MKQYMLKNSNNDCLILDAINDIQAMKKVIEILCQIANCVFIVKEIEDKKNVNIITK